MKLANTKRINEKKCKLKALDKLFLSWNQYKGS